MAQRFFLTAQVGLAAPSNLGQVAKSIKEAFKSVSKIETQLKLPSNLASFKAKIKQTLHDLSDIKTTIRVDTANLSSVKGILKRHFTGIATVDLKVNVPPSTLATIDRLKRKLDSLGKINISLKLPPGFASTVSLLQSLSKNRTFTIKTNAGGTAAAAAATKTLGKNIQDNTDYITKFAAQSNYAIRRYAAFTVVAANFFALFSAVRTGISDAIAFEKEMVKIRQVTGTSIAGLQGLSDSVTGLATSLGVSSKKLLDVSQILAQAGLNAADTRTALDALAKTELSATFENIGDTAEGAIAIMAQFGTSVGDLKSQLSSINAVAGKFAVESSDIITAVRRTGGAFQAAGGNLNELIALFTSVRATTRESAESIATGFRTIFTRLQRIRTQNFLGNLGIELKNAEGQFVGPYEAIERLGKALAKIKSTDPRFSQIIEELGGFRQVSKVIPLIQQEEKRRQALNIAKRSGNSLDEDAIKAQDTLANKLNKVTEEFSALIRRLTQTDTFKEITNLMLNMAKTAIKLTDALTPLLPLLAVFGTATVAPIAKKYGMALFGYDTGSSSGSTGGAVKSNRGGGLKGTVSRVSSNITNNPLTSITLASLFIPAIIDTSAAMFGASKQTKAWTEEITKFAGQAGIVGTVFTSISKYLVQAGANVTLDKNQEQLTTLSKQRRGLSKLANSYNRDAVKEEIRQMAKPAANRDFTARNFYIQHAADAGRRYSDVQAQRKALILTNKKMNDNVAALNAFGIGIGVAIGALSSLSTTLSNLGKSDIEKQNYGAAKVKIAASDTVGGLGVGAAAGYGLASLVLLVNPLSIGLAALTGAVALAVGGLTGFAIGLHDASQQVENAKFAQEFKYLETKLKRISGGSADSLSNSASIEFFLGKAIDKLESNSGADIETLKGSFTNIVTDLEEYITKSVNEKIKVGANPNKAREEEEVSAELKQFSGSVQNAIEVLSRFGNVSAVDLNENIKKQIAARRAAVSSEIKLNEAVQREIDRTIAISSILADINDLATTTDSVIDSFHNFEAAIESSTGALKVNLGSAIFNDTNVNNVNRFKTTTNRIGSFFGEEGARLSSEIGAIPDINRQVPNILLKLQNQDSFQESGQFVDRFEEELKNLQIPQNLITSLVDQMTHLIGAEAKPDKLITDIRADRFGVGAKITKVLEQFTDVFKKAGTEIEKALSFVEEQFAKGRSISESITEKLNDIVDLNSQRVEAVAEFRGVPVDTAELNRLEIQRKKNILGNNSGLVDNPEAIAQALRTRRSQLAGLNKTIAEQPNNANALISRDALVSEISRLNSSLKDLTNPTKQLAIINKELAQENATLEARKGISEIAAFGSFDDTRRLGLNLAGARKLAENPENANNIPRHLIGDIISFLKGLGDAKIFGKRATEIVDSANKAILVKQGGFSPETASDIVDKQSAAKADIATRLNEVYDKAEKANKELIDFLKQNSEENSNTLREFLSNTLRSAELTPLIGQKSALENNRVGLTLSKNIAEGNRDSVTKLSKAIGLDLTQGNNIGILRNNLSDIDLYKKNKETISKINSAEFLPFTDGKESVRAYSRRARGILQSNGFSEAEIVQALNDVSNSGTAGGKSLISNSAVLNYSGDYQKIRKEKLDNLKDDQAGLTRNFSSANINPEAVLNSLEKVRDLLTSENFKDIVSFKDLTASIVEYSDKLGKIELDLINLDSSIRSVNNKQYVPTATPHKARGGKIAGYGGGDIVNAKLEPGEYVMNKKAVRAIGVDHLDKMNYGNVKGYKNGGLFTDKSSLNYRINQANDIFYKQFGINIKDLVGGRIDKVSSLESPRGVPARGMFHVVNGQSRISLHNTRANIGTVLEEALHAFDYQGGNKRGFASRLNSRNPFGRIAGLNTPDNINTLMSLEGYDKGHPNTLAARQQYVAQRHEFAAKAFKQYLLNPEKFQSTNPELFEKVEAEAAKLRGFIQNNASRRRLGLPTIKPRKVVGLGELFGRGLSKVGSTISNTSGNILNGIGSKIANSSILKAVNSGVYNTASGIGGAIDSVIGLPSYLKNLAGGTSTNGSSVSAPPASYLDKLKSNSGGYGPFPAITPPQDSYLNKLRKQALTYGPSKALQSPTSAAPRRLGTITGGGYGPFPTLQLPPKSGLPFNTDPTNLGHVASSYKGGVAKSPNLLQRAIFNTAEGIGGVVNKLGNNRVTRAIGAGVEKFDSGVGSVFDTIGGAIGSRLPKFASKAATGYTGPKTIGVGTLLGRAASKTASAIGNSSFGKIAGKTGSVLGKVGKVAIVGQSVYDAYKGKRISAVGNLANLTAAGFGGNLLGNTLHNALTPITGAKGVDFFGNGFSDALQGLADDGGFGKAHYAAQQNDEELQRRQRTSYLQNKAISAQENKAYSDDTQRKVAAAQAEAAARNKASDVQYAKTKTSIGQFHSDEVDRKNTNTFETQASITGSRAAAAEGRDQLAEAKAQAERIKQDHAKAQLRTASVRITSAITPSGIDKEADYNAQRVKFGLPSLAQPSQPSNADVLSQAKSTQDSANEKSRSENAIILENARKEREAAIAKSKAENAPILAKAAEERKARELKSASTQATNMQDRLAKGAADFNKPINLQGTPAGQAYYSVKDDISVPIKAAKAFNSTPANLTSSKKSSKGSKGGAAGMPNLNSFNTAIEKFSGTSTELAKAMNAFPHEIKLTATHNVNVTLNGAEVLKTMMPAVQELVVATTTQKINELIQTRMPGVPPMQNDKAPAKEGVK